MQGNESDDVDFNWDEIDKAVNQREKSLKRPISAISGSSGTFSQKQRLLNPMNDNTFPTEGRLCSLCLKKAEASFKSKFCSFCKKEVSFISESQAALLLSHLIESPTRSVPNRDLNSLPPVLPKKMPAMKHNSEQRLTRSNSISKYFQQNTKASSKDISYKTKPFRTASVLEEPEIYILKPGFFVDFSRLSSWSFPKSKDYSIREYQRSIINSCLFQNTLVTLPTGLGKTFIAAVVMLNYLTWFPDSLIVFMAPTKPLVSQQIESCHKIVGIAEARTALLMGNVSPFKRQALWKSKNIVYCTPQTFQSDIENNFVDFKRISLVVVDEAHKATGNYAYKVVVEKIHSQCQSFRVLALSATPGKNIEKIQEVIDNLLISKLEFRSEDDEDVTPYTFHKHVQTLEVKSSAEIEFPQLLLKLDSFIQPVLDLLRTTKFGKSLRSRAAFITQSQVLLAKQSLETQQAAEKMPHKVFSRIRADISFMMSLLHLRKKLSTQGLSPFLSSISKLFCLKILKDQDAFEIKQERDFFKLSLNKKKLASRQDFLSFLKQCATLDATGNEAANPKVVKTIEILKNHFETSRMSNTRTAAIVFCQFRDTVKLVCKSICSSESLKLVASPFIGQSGTKSNEIENDKGQNQKQQQKIVKRFRDGEIDVLVATCIAEEGLDIGSVDLIICFDAPLSPIRMVQRFGRAGRKRSGKIFVLTSGQAEKAAVSFGRKKGKNIYKLLKESSGRFKFYHQKGNWLYFAEKEMRLKKLNPTIDYVNIAIGDYKDEVVGGKLISRSEKKRRKDKDTKLKRNKSAYSSSSIPSVSISLSGKFSSLSSLKSRKSPVSRQKKAQTIDIFDNDVFSVSSEAPSETDIVYLSSSSEDEPTRCNVNNSSRQNKNEKPQEFENDSDIENDSPISLPRKRLRKRKSTETSSTSVLKSIENTNLNKNVENDMFEVEAEEEGGISDTDSGEEEDLDADLESLLDNRPLSQLSLSLTPGVDEEEVRLEMEENSRNFHHKVRAEASPSPVFLRRAKKFGLNISTINMQMDKIKKASEVSRIAGSTTSS